MSKYILQQEQGRKGFEELNRVFTALKEMGVKNVEIDLSLARGLDYYTSTIFETIIMESTESKRFGSVASGGRYDNLINLFIGKQVPAVGISIGIDRLFAAMEELGLVQKNNVVDVLVLNLDAQFEQQYLQMVTSLRNAEINAEMYYSETDLKKQFTFAEAKNIPYAVIFDEKEAKKGIVLIRDLKTRKQTEVKIKDLAKTVKKLLK